MTRASLDIFFFLGWGIPLSFKVIKTKTLEEALGLIVSGNKIF